MWGISLQADNTDMYALDTEKKKHSILKYLKASLPPNTPNTPLDAATPW